jgi:V-type H+-transporting ATPase subunit a
MVIGIILRGLNNLYYKDNLSFFFEFIPQIIFMLLLFGYMVVLIYIKWLTDYSLDTSRAPSIITILMNLALKNGSVEGKPVWGTIIREEQINRLFFYISILCIPIILLVKPLIKIIKKAKKEEENGQKYLDLLTNDYKELFLDYIKEEQNKTEGITDIFVHQIIETIEFVLGCISNTASYLRLWALSLAHSQLAKVFFEKCVINIASYYNFVFVIIGYFLFANITISVLMGMDLLEAFLHTLRLHWVEFQNKFYAADGVLFEPFSFKTLFDDE